LRCASLCMTAPLSPSLSLFPYTTLFRSCAASGTGDEVRWRAEEIEEIRSLWIGEMEPLAPDPTNRYADDPGALALGHQLFFDTRDRKSTRLNSSHVKISYAVFCLKKQTT